MPEASSLKNWTPDRITQTIMLSACFSQANSIAETSHAFWMFILLCAIALANEVILAALYHVFYTADGTHRYAALVRHAETDTAIILTNSLLQTLLMLRIYSLTIASYLGNRIIMDMLFVGTSDVVKILVVMIVSFTIFMAFDIANTAYKNSKAIIKRV